MASFSTKKWFLCRSPSKEGSMHLEKKGARDNSAKTILQLQSYIFILSCKDCPASRHGKQSEFEEKAEPWGHCCPPAEFLSAENHPNSCTFPFPLLGARWTVRFGGHRLSTVAFVDPLWTSWQYLVKFLGFTGTTLTNLTGIVSELPSCQQSKQITCLYISTSTSLVQPKLIFHLI